MGAYHLVSKLYIDAFLPTTPFLAAFTQPFRFRNSFNRPHRAVAWFVGVAVLGVGGGWQTPAYSQSPSFRQLEERVYQFNNALNYTASQKLLLPVLQRDTYTADEKYQAAILLSYTYKRVQDYQSTLLFLQTARQFARQTAKKGQYQATILAQEAFVYFDTHRYPKADSVMTALERTNFRYIDLENKAKLVMQQGYLLFLTKQYAGAEATYDKAIGWLQVASPCDLPMIYVKKMQLYDAMHQPVQLQQALRQSNRYADSCGIIKYTIYAYGELLNIYLAHNDLPNIAATKRTVDSLDKIYAQTENVAALHNQKESLLLADKDRNLARQRSNGTYLMAGLGGAVLLALALLAGLMLYRRRQRIMEDEFVAMRADLNQYVALGRHTLPDPDKPPLEKVAYPLLSDRQQTVLTCLMAGLSNKDIAEQLSVSENTVKYHLKNIYLLLEIKDRKDLLINFRK